MIKSYNQRGGGYIKISEDSPNSYGELQNYVTYGNEVCGNFYMDDYDELVIDEDSIVTGQQSVCKHDHYSDYIWHTHPYNGKYYPSVEDILKVMKNKGRIVRSWIFTKHGFWTIEYDGDEPYTEYDAREEGYEPTYLGSMLLNEYPRVIDGSGFIDEANDRFYRETHGGHQYNNNVIWNYIDYLEGGIPGLDIWWNNY